MHNAIKTVRGTLKTARTYMSIFGLKGMLHIAYCAVSKNKKWVAVNPRWSKHPLFLRLNSSDISVFRQVFIDREYAVTQQLALGTGLVIDGGANIGLTSVFLTDRHPGISVCAIEPDESNFRLLQQNTASYPNITCLRVALWDHDGVVRISQENASEWGFRVEESNDSGAPEIPAIRLSTLFRQLGSPRVALLKLDVEGAEKEILMEADSWIDAVDNIVIELHEHLQPGCSALFDRVTSSFHLVDRGRELTLVSRRGS